MLTNNHSWLKEFSSEKKRKKKRKKEQHTDKLNSFKI